MTFNYQDQKQFEEILNRQHYPHLIAFFSRRYARVAIEEVMDLNQQMKGIDIKIYAPDKAVLKGELKNDKHVNSPNIFLEDVSNSASGSPGWTEKCESEFLSYGFCDPTSNKLTKLFVYEMQPLKRWYQANKENYRVCPIPNDGYFTYGRPVPWEDIEQFLLYKWELNEGRHKRRAMKLDKLSQWI